jgi:tetratricopeptide (TPR) repeat protein
MTEDYFVKKIKPYCMFGEIPYKVDGSNEVELYSIIQEAERLYPNSINYDFNITLGGAYNAHKLNCGQVDNRKYCLEKAIAYFKIAYAVAKTKKDKIYTAGALGMWLVNHKKVRNLDEGIYYLEEVLKLTNLYEPSLCWLAEGYYKQGQYDKAIEFGLNLHQKDKKECDNNGNSFASMPLEVVAKSCRKIGNIFKKNGDYIRAIQYFSKIKELNLSTDNDNKILAKLKESI